MVIKNSLSKKVIICRYVITGLTMHLVGFTIGFISIGWLLSGVMEPGLQIHSGLSVLTHFGELMYLIGFVMVVVVAARVGVPMKYLVIAGSVIGVGLFYNYLHHDIHIASGIGFGLSHIDHYAIGNILTTISVVALVVLMFVHNRFRLQAPKATA
jgi:hypothetical protein